MTTAEVSLSSYKNRELMKQKSLKTLERRVFYILLTIRDMWQHNECKINLNLGGVKKKGILLTIRDMWHFTLLEQTYQESRLYGNPNPNTIYVG